jgi:hypothetical protein
MLSLGPLYSCRTVTRKCLSYQLCYLHTVVESSQDIVFCHTKMYDHHTVVGPSQDTVLSHTNFMTTLQLLYRHKAPCFVIPTYDHSTVVEPSKDSVLCYINVIITIQL